MERLRGGLYEYGVTIGEAEVHVKSDLKRAVEAAIESVERNMDELVGYIKENPEFQYSLRPLTVKPDAPRIVKVMAEASRNADVGPMASVAGALADLAVEAMVRCGARVAVVEDGGEISARTDRPIYIDLLSNNPLISGKLGFEVRDEDTPIGIATSTGRSEHAISFGEADSATIVADRASIADAAATAVCNSVTGTDVEASIRRGIRTAMEIKGVRGVIVIRGGYVGMAGNLPRMVRVTEGRTRRQV